MSQTMGHLIEELAGGVPGGRSLKAVIPGGASSPILGPEALDILCAPEALAAAGSMAGSAGVMVIDDATCIVQLALRTAAFYTHESCGKCTPCREGTSWEEKILQRILDGQGRPSDIDALLDVADNISPGPYPNAAFAEAGLEAIPFPPKQTTICPLGPSSVAPITSAIRRFRPEFEAKITKRDLIGLTAEPVAPSAVPVGGH